MFSGYGVLHIRYAAGYVSQIQSHLVPRFLAGIHERILFSVTVTGAENFNEIRSFLVDGSWLRWQHSFSLFVSLFDCEMWVALAGNVIALGGLATMPILFALVFAAKHVQDRLMLAAGLLFGLLGLSLHMGSLESPAQSAVTYFT